MPKKWCLNWFHKKTLTLKNCSFLLCRGGLFFVAPRGFFGAYLGYAPLCPNHAFPVCPIWLAWWNATSFTYHFPMACRVKSRFSPVFPMMTVFRRVFPWTFLWNFPAFTRAIDPWPVLPGPRRWRSSPRGARHSACRPNHRASWKSVSGFAKNPPGWENYKQVVRDRYYFCRKKTMFDIVWCYIVHF